MRKETQIQISKQAFIDLYLLIVALNDYDLEPDVKERVQSLEMAVNDKFEKMAKRKAFTDYKTAKPSTNDREIKRKEYLDLTGINQDWISQIEIPL